MAGRDKTKSNIEQKLQQTLGNMKNHKSLKKYILSNKKQKKFFLHLFYKSDFLLGI